MKLVRDVSVITYLSSARAPPPYWMLSDAVLWMQKYINLSGTVTYVIQLYSESVVKGSQVQVGHMVQTDVPYWSLTGSLEPSLSAEYQTTRQVELEEGKPMYLCIYVVVVYWSCT